MSSEDMDTRTRILEATWRLLEQHQGQGVKMSDIARAVGISRQAVYLHFASRTELMIATMNYVDEVKGLYERLNRLESAQSGAESMDTLVEIWGNYIPEIYGLAKAMLMTKDSDAAMAAAWNNSMGCLRDVCQQTIEMLAREGKLVPAWSIADATDLFVTVVSISNWEQLNKECHWSNEQYIECIKILLKRTFVA
jgi:AcrR family transcriptional regulator